MIEKFVEFFFEEMNVIVINNVDKIKYILEVCITITYINNNKTYMTPIIVCCSSSVNLDNKFRS